MARASVYILVFAVCLLAALGLVMLASTSYFLEGAGGEAYGMLRQQGMWLALSCVCAGFMVVYPYHKLYRWRWWLYGISALGLVLCFVPFIGVEVNGASRWIGLRALGFPQIQFQPSELAKLTTVIVLAGWFAHHEPLTKQFKSGFLLPGLIIGFMVVLVGLEVDLGSAALLAAVGGALMFVAGSRLLYIAPVAIAALVSLGAVIQFMPNRVERIMAFLNLEAHKDTLGMQQWRSLIAFGSGGTEGVGLGNGRLKMHYLPEAHTDFIYPMVGEEFGLLGSYVVVGLFLLVVLAGMSIAHRAPDRFSRLLAFGITLTLALEALINMGVTTALLPNKGLPLPFVSKGGSSLLFAMIGVGLLVNIHWRSKDRGKNDLPLPRRRRISGVPHHGPL